MARAAALLLTAWAGSLWTVCALVAPLLFATLPDRQAAGRMAARLFQIEAWLGLAVALALAMLLLMRWERPDRLGPLWLLAASAAAPLASELLLGPQMNAARAAHDMARFGMLHGISAALFAAACLGTLALVWRFNRPAT